MRKILDNKIFRTILCAFVITSILYLPALLNMILIYVGIKNENISAILSLIIYVSILALIYFPELKEEFIIFKNNFKNSIDNGFKYWLLGLFIMLISNLVINYFIMGGNIAANEEMNRVAIAQNPLWYTIISVALIAPLLEELIFRKSTDKIFNKELSYCILCALIFGFAHVMADLSNIINLVYIIPYGALGFAFALMDKKTNTIFTSITFHSFHNIIMLLLLLMVL